MSKTVNSQKLMVKSYQGFTLIELLVVISIIGILTTLLFANLNTARERARDAQRKSDLRNLQTALRFYYNDNTGFPASSSNQIVGCGPKASRTVCAWGTSWATSEGQTYMATLVKDPLPDRIYHYVQTDSDTYSLEACLENRSDDKCSTTTEDWCNTDLHGCLYIVKP